MAAPTDVVLTLAGLNAGLSLPPAVLAVAAPEGAAFMSNEAVDPYLACQPCSILEVLPAVPGPGVEACHSPEPR